MLVVTGNPNLGSTKQLLSY